MICLYKSEFYIIQGVFVRFDAFDDVLNLSWGNGFSFPHPPPPPIPLSSTFLLNNNLLTNTIDIDIVNVISNVIVIDSSPAH